MGTIRLDTLSAAPYFYRIVAVDPDDPTDDSRDLLVQVDWDYPGVASTFGWWIGHVPVRDGAIGGADIAGFRTCPNEHDGTDGTITCPTCGTPPSTFIESAAAWLDDHDGATADDPGYFSTD